MAFILVRHKVADFNKWKPVFYDHGEARKKSGSQGGRVFRNADDQNEVVILLAWDNIENARRFAQSEDLRNAMERAGVADQPDVYFLQEVAETAE